MKKKVLLTLNPRVITGEDDSPTQSGLVSCLDQHSDLLVIPAGSYDFADGRVRAYKRCKNGKFSDLGMISPRADLWVVYSDGYYLNPRDYGFHMRRDFFNAQIEFHQKQLSEGNIGMVVNTPGSEVKTLKNWLATLDFDQTRVNPTYVFTGFDEVYDFQKKEKTIVVKPSWGGGSMGVELIENEESVREFQNKVEQSADSDLRDYVFQVYYPGNKKRLWFAGGKFVTGKKEYNHETPWSRQSIEHSVYVYDDDTFEGFSEDLATAQQLCNLSGISFGAIDFIEDRVNDINGGGTVFTASLKDDLVIDADRD